jgi:hypothetical protein
VWASYFLAYGVRVHDGPRFGWGVESALPRVRLACLG